MNSDTGEKCVKVYAALSSYIVLSGIYFILAFGYGILSWKRPGLGLENIGIMLFMIGVLWVVWLRGFRIRITSDKFEYRNGFHRSTIVPLSEIKDTKHSWIEWKLLGRHLQIPRLIVTYGAHAECVIINTKPFSKQEARGRFLVI